jgi:hypothetical protein
MFGRWVHMLVNEGSQCAERLANRGASDADFAPPAVNDSALLSLRPIGH